MLRILLNYETNDAKLLQLVLLGQIELLPILANLPNVADRISLKCTLKPLSMEEASDMVAFRLQEAGYRSRAPLFLEEAMREIHEYSEGYPRRIAMLCHHALRHLVMLNRRYVDQALVEELIQREVEAGWSPLARAKRLQQSSC